DRLFIGESDFETLEKVRNVDVPPPSKVNPAVPAALEKIILRALKKEVEDRYQWASEMQEELQAFLMVREPVFTAKQLSGWMREQFAVEMKREQEILDEQRRVGKEVLTAPIAQSFGAAVSMISATPTPTPIGDLPASSTRVVDDADLVEVNEEPDDGGDFGEKTTVSSPAFGGVASPQAAALPEQKTQILSDQAGISVPAAVNGRSGASVHADELPAQSTVILEGGMAAVQVGPLRAGPQAATLMAQPAPILPVRAQMPAHPATGSHLTPGTGQVGPLPYAPARSTLWKDILIGVGVAAALVLAVLGVRALVGHGPPSGTVVVMAQPATAAEVLVDGKVRGHLAPGKPLTLKHVVAGAHAMLVRAADGSEFRQQLTVAAGDVAVLAASLKPPGLGSGTLKLNVLTAGARVYVDGAELTDGAWKSPIPLRADVPHEIRVTKPEREDVKLTIQLKAGEVQSRDIELLPGYGKIEVASDPPGAEVSVNGQHAGATPITVPDLDPGKSARVTVRHRGFAAITKYVSFEKGLAQTLDLKMVASSDDGFANGAQPEKPTELVAADKSARSGGAVLADVRVPEPSSEHEHGHEHHARPKAIESKDELAPIKIGAPHEIKEAAHVSNQPGYLVANTQPWARVIIDGHDTGKTTPIAPRSKIALKPGKHVVTFVVSGKRFHFDVMIKPGEDTRLIKQLTDTP
ncbi:MAG: PEGA domain-containing protein, partial [Polyangia bacterium]